MAKASDHLNSTGTIRAGRVVVEGELEINPSIPVGNIQQFQAPDYMAEDISDQEMDCYCGYAGTQVKDFIQVEIKHSQLGYLYVCPECGSAKFAKSGIVRLVTLRGSL